MMTSVTHSVRLARHPYTRTEVVGGIAARVRRGPSERLNVNFTLDADLGRLRIPPPQPSRMADRLWQHTCFELFIAMNDSPAYHEFNFAPSGEWTIYAFRDYRDQALLSDDVPAPEITVRRSADRLELDAVVHLDNLSAMHAQAPLRLALSAVIEEASASLSYWALRHSPGKPDFHHPDAFALMLRAPGVDSVSDPS